MKKLTQFLSAAVVGLTLAGAAQAEPVCPDGSPIPAGGMDACPTNAVPEPGSLALVGLAVAGALVVARRRKQ